MKTRADSRSTSRPSTIVSADCHFERSEESASPSGAGPSVPQELSSNITRHFNAGYAIVGTLLILTIILVRIIALNADPPASLSWSTGIYTDEGYYTNDARSAVLFHHWALGNFHSAILSPLVYLVQLAVFHIAGVGLIQARAISVAFGLLTVLLLALSLQRLYGAPAAWAGALLLGLSAPFAFYNRLALMETPAAFFLTLAFFLTTLPKKGVWAGITLGIGAVVKPTALLAAPALLTRGRPRAWPILAGFAGALVLYAALWYEPNHADLARMNGYYALHQYLPHSVAGLGHNIWRGLVTGGGDGVLPYLIHFAPALFVLAIAGLFAAARQRREGDVLLALWLLIPITAFLALSYSPSRYYILFWPALAGLAARGLTRVAEEAKASAALSRAFSVSAIVVFLITNGWLFASAWLGRSYGLRDGGYTLAKELPAGSVLAGQMGPSLCLTNNLSAIMVQPGLANDISPVERYHVSYILVTRSTFWNTWWKKAYPPIITPDRRILTLKVGNSYLVDVYRVR